MRELGFEMDSSSHKDGPNEQRRSGRKNNEQRRARPRRIMLVTLVTKGHRPKLAVSHPNELMIVAAGLQARNSPMELTADTQQIAQYSPTSTPILDVLRPLTSPKRDKISAGEYFFLSSAIIMILIGLPLLRQALLALPSFGSTRALIVALLVIPGVALGAAMLSHECGHLLVAWMSGFRPALRSHASVTEAYGAVRKFYSCEGLRLGIVRLGQGKMAQRPDQLRRRLLFLVMGGPLASLLVPPILEITAYITNAGSVSTYFIHVFSTLSVLVGIAELIPDTGKGNFSDGARILMLLKKDGSAQRWLTNLQLQLSLSRGEHPRTWNEAAVLGSTAIDDDSRDGVTAHWLGYLWAAERGDITSATKYLEEALAAPISVSAAAGLRDRLFLEAAVFQAWFREDAAKAQFWAGRIRDRELSPLQHLRLQIGLLWSAGKLFDAWETLGDYFQTLSEIPASPARDLMEQSAREWKAQMESRMLTRAWRSMYSMSREAELSVMQEPMSGTPVLD
jgi:hypothetical protein